MLIAIAIAEEIQGLQRSSASFELLSFLWLWQEESWETSCQSYKFLQFLQIPFLTSSTLWSLLLLFSLFIPNLCPHCFHWLRIGRSSSFPHWCWQIWAGYWHFVIVQLITLGHDQSELSWCRCNLNCWDSLLEYWDWHFSKREGGTMKRRRLVSWIWNRILQREFKKSFIKVRREANEIVNVLVLLLDPWPWPYHFRCLFAKPISINVINVSLGNCLESIQSNFSTSAEE